jgi:hypothetical protein
MPSFLLSVLIFPPLFVAPSFIASVLPTSVRSSSFYLLLSFSTSLFQSFLSLSTSYLFLSFLTFYRQSCSLLSLILLFLHFILTSFYPLFHFVFVSFKHSLLRFSFSEVNCLLGCDIVHSGRSFLPSFFDASYFSPSLSVFLSLSLFRLAIFFFHALVPLNHYFPHNSTIAERPSQEPHILSSFSLLLLACSGLLSRPPTPWILPTLSMLSLHFYSEDGGKCLLHYMAQYLRGA